MKKLWRRLRLWNVWFNPFFSEDLYCAEMISQLKYAAMVTKDVTLAMAEMKPILLKGDNDELPILPKTAV